MPRRGEVLGRIVTMYGASHMLVECADGKQRNCRIPGRSRRRVRIREGDTVLVEPWSIEGDRRGDIIWRYDRLQVDWLRRKGFLK